MTPRIIKKSTQIELSNKKSNSKENSKGGGKLKTPNSKQMKITPQKKQKNSEEHSRIKTEIFERNKKNTEENTKRNLFEEQIKSLTRNSKSSSNLDLKVSSSISSSNTKKSLENMRKIFLKKSKENLCVKTINLIESENLSPFIKNFNSENLINGKKNSERLGTSPRDQLSLIDLNKNNEIYFKTSSTPLFNKKHCPIQKLNFDFSNQKISKEETINLKRQKKILKKKISANEFFKKKFKKSLKLLKKDNNNLIEKCEQYKDENLDLKEELQSIKKELNEVKKENKSFQLYLELKETFFQEENSLNFLKPKFMNKVIYSKDEFQIYKDYPLGKGGFGSVYPGKIKSTNKEIAIKVMEVEKSRVNMVINEIKPMIFFEHPNLVKLYGISLKELKEKNSFKIYFLMEKMDFDLKKLVLKSSLNFSLKEKLKILLDVLKGLMIIHQNDFVHCDIKMPNILINEKTAKIADFGISKHILLGNTKKTSLEGYSERYTSFEYIVESKVSNKMDIWSFGILMYEFIYEKIAWSPLTALQTVIKVTNKTPFFKFNEKLFPDIDWIVEKCLNYDHKLRPTAKQLYFTLNKIYNNFESL